MINSVRTSSTILNQIVLLIWLVVLFSGVPDLQEVARLKKNRNFLLLSGS